MPYNVSLLVHDIYYSQPEILTTRRVTWVIPRTKREGMSQKVSSVALNVLRLFAPLTSANRSYRLINPKIGGQICEPKNSVLVRHNDTRWKPMSLQRWLAACEKGN